MAELILKEAFTIVIDLAQDNIIDKFEVKQDPEVLEPIWNEQNEAIETVINHVKSITVNQLNIRVIWGDGQHGISYVTFDLQAELDGYLRALEDHDGWLGAEVHMPDDNGKFEELEQKTKESLLASGYDEDDLTND